MTLKGGIAPWANVKNFNREMGTKHYELTNHLGNVMSVISDWKIGVDDGQYDTTGSKTSSVADTILDYYIADVIQYQDYYPFGSVMPGRNSTSASGYRYGFNGMEKDDEVKGSNNSLDFGARIYDPRVGRFLSVDPISKNKPSISPYSFANNSPIYFIDNKGEDAFGYIGEDGKLYINVTYHAVSEGVDSYTVEEMRQIENLANEFWSQAVGMEVTLADGTVVEIGGVKVQVKQGGDFSTTVATVKSTGENALFKVDGEFIKKRSESGRAEAVTTNEISRNTMNTTFLNRDKFGKVLVGDEADNKNNAIVDETGHVMGTTHPERMEGESRKDFNDRRESDFGLLERGKESVTGELQLSPKDLQNIVESDEFELIERTK